MNKNFDKADLIDDEAHGEKMVLNLGPSHPSTHGVLRLRVELDGDLVTKCEPVIGQLHRGSEKIAETMNYLQFMPYTDRLDYLSSISNNIAYALAVEKLANIDVPARCKCIRVLCSEIARISSHLVGIASYAMDTGGWTVFMYCWTIRERIYSLFEELTGARLTTNYARIGGLARDIPDGWLGKVNKFCARLTTDIDEIDKLITRNKIFMQRTVGIAVISKEKAMSIGLTGVNLRASGVDSDLRKDNPYLDYESYDFDIPIGTTGDCYDRWLLRIEEIKQSLKICKQAIEKMPTGAYKIDDPKIILPEKEKVLTKMPSLIQNFMLATGGPNIPEGEVYFEVENPKGALGFYINSKGGGVPYRLRIKGPSFVSLSALEEIVKGHLLTDIPCILGSLDFVLGECDR